jgi:hypothetical protein
MIVECMLTTSATVFIYHLNLLIIGSLWRFLFLFFEKKYLVGKNDLFKLEIPFFVTCDCFDQN